MNPEEMDFFAAMDLMSRGMEIEEMFGGDVAPDELEALVKESEEISATLHAYDMAHQGSQHFLPPISPLRKLQLA